MLGRLRQASLRLLDRMTEFEERFRRLLRSLWERNLPWFSLYRNLKTKNSMEMGIVMFKVQVHCRRLRIGIPSVIEPRVSNAKSAKIHFPSGIS
jgi:hypothetical protein